MMESIMVLVASLVIGLLSGSAAFRVVEYWRYRGNRKRLSAGSKWFLFDKYHATVTEISSGVVTYKYWDPSCPGIYAVRSLPVGDFVSYVTPRGDA